MQLDQQPKCAFIGRASWCAHDWILKECSLLVKKKKKKNRFSFLFVVFFFFLLARTCSHVHHISTFFSSPFIPSPIAYTSYAEAYQQSGYSPAGYSPEDAVPTVPPRRLPTAGQVDGNDQVRFNAWRTRKRLIHGDWYKLADVEKEWRRSWIFLWLECTVSSSARITTWWWGTTRSKKKKIHLKKKTRFDQSAALERATILSSLASGSMHSL